MRRYNKEIFPLYSSFKGGADGKVVNADKRQNVLANPRLLGVIFLAIVGGGFSFYKVWRFFHPQAAQEPAKTAQGSSTPASAGKQPSAPEKPPVKTFSGSWRIVGRYVAANGITWVVVANQAGQLRVESPSNFYGSGMEAVGELDGERVTVWTGPVQAVGAGMLEVKK